MLLALRKFKMTPLHNNTETKKQEKYDRTVFGKQLKCDINGLDFFANIELKFCVVVAELHPQIIFLNICV